jgi:stress response protein YsnF
MPLHKIRDFDTNYQEQNSQEDIRGFDLYSEDQKVGSVKDLLVDDQGHFRYLVINTGVWGFDKPVLLPIGRSRIDEGNQRVDAVNLSRAQVEALPEFADDITLDSKYEDWVRRVYKSSALAVPASSGVGYSGYETAPLTPIDAPPSHGVGYEGYETAPPSPNNVPASLGVGYGGYETAPLTPTDAPPSHGVGYDGYENAPPAPELALSPDISSEASDRHSYTYDQDPALYEMSDQNHRLLKQYEARLIVNR